MLREGGSGELWGGQRSGSSTRHAASLSPSVAASTSLSEPLGDTQSENMNPNTSASLKVDEQGWPISSAVPPPTEVTLSRASAAAASLAENSRSGPLPSGLHLGTTATAGQILAAAEESPRVPYPRATAADAAAMWEQRVASRLEEMHQAAGSEPSPARRPAFGLPMAYSSALTGTLGVAGLRSAVQGSASSHGLSSPLGTLTAPGIRSLGLGVPTSPTRAQRHIDRVPRNPSTSFSMGYRFIKVAS